MNICGAGYNGQTGFRVAPKYESPFRYYLHHQTPNQLRLISFADHKLPNLISSLENIWLGKGFIFFLDKFHERLSVVAVINFFKTRLYAAFAYAFELKLVFDFRFAPVLDSEFSARESFRKSLLIQKSIGDKLGEDFLHIVLPQAVRVKFVAHFLMAALLIGAIPFRFRPCFRRCIRFQDG
jgi:hypothetical protein